MTLRQLAISTLLGFAPAGALAGLLQTASTPLLAQKSSAEHGAATTASPRQEATSQQLLASYATVPLHFEENQGQTDSRVKYLARGSGYTLFLTSTEVVLVAANRATDTDLAPRGQANSEEPDGKSATLLRMQFIDASPRPKIVGSDELRGKTHYFLGSDSKQWRTDVPTYARVRYREIYPGIDLVFYGHQGQLEYDFVLAPGANPETIRLRFEGVQRLEVDAHGDLVLSTTGSSVRLRKPIVYQEVNGVRKDIPGQFQLQGEDQVGFLVAAHDATRPLIIDPVLVYSTYLGGSGGDASITLAVDTLSSVYVAGRTSSINFPITAEAFQLSYGGGPGDAFVAKFDSAGTALVYSTYLGGIANDQANAIAVDALGQAYITGFTGSVDFPTKDPIQSTLAGAADAFVTKLNAAGSELVYSTYLGGILLDLGNGIVTDRSGNAYVSGRTASADMPTTPGAFQETFAGVQDGFVAKVDAGGSQLVYLTYIGGSGDDFGRRIALDRAGRAYVVGRTGSADFPTTVGAFQTTFGGGLVDAFAATLNAEGSALVYATYLGGSGDDEGTGIGLNRAGRVYLAGWTGSPDFPITSAAFQTRYGGGPFDVFVTKLDRKGSGLVYSTFLGGSGSDTTFFGLAVDRSGRAHISGQTGSVDFPVARPLPNGDGLHGVSDAFITKFHARGSRLVYSTYLGGSGTENAQGMAVDRSGNAYVSGTTGSIDFPTVRAIQPGFGGGPNDAFVAKISDRQDDEDDEDDGNDDDDIDDDDNGAP